MPSRVVLLLATLLIPCGFAAPALPPSQPPTKQSFKVERVRNPDFTGHDATATLLNAYRRWGMDLPPRLAESQRMPEKRRRAQASSGTEDGEVTATPVGNDVEFVSVIEIGGQEMNMIFDTGSSDLWVFNTQLPERATANHKVYDPSKSASFQTLDGSTFSITYGDGSRAEGNVGTDTVNIGGATVTSQAIELPTQISESFVNDTAVSGLMGLAFSKLNTVKPVRQKTFLDNALPTLAEPLFTADLKSGTAGSYEFGQIDTTKFNGSLSWAPVNAANGFWQISSESFSIENGTPISAAGGQAIVDTGTTLMLVNPEVVNAYYSNVARAVNDEESGGIIFPCDSDLPDLQVDIGGVYMANIPGNIINFSNIDGKNCLGGLQATTSNLQIYGDIFLKAQFVVFNAGNNSIGVAAHN